jgi:hypothetical protein
MKFQLASEQLIVESSDADIFELRPLEEFLLNEYQAGALERVLHDDELQCERESGWRISTCLNNLNAYRAFLCLALWLAYLIAVRRHGIRL